MVRVNGIIILIIIVLVVILVILFYFLKTGDIPPSKQCLFKKTADKRKKTFICIASPTAPHKVKFEQGDINIWIEWSPSAQAESYIIYWSQTDGFDYKTQSIGLHPTVNNGALLSNGLFCGGLFYFVIIAVNDCGESKPTKQFEAIIGFPEFFRICAEENIDFCISGTAGNESKVVPSIDCMDGGCIWVYDSNTKQIKLAQDESICLQQDGTNLEVVTCDADSEEEFDITFGPTTLCNVTTDDCFRSPQDGGGETETGDVSMATDDGGDDFHWFIKCATKPLPPPVI